MERIPLVVVGAHLRGEALNHQLTERGAVFDRSVRTAPVYRLFALKGPIAKPGLIRVGPEQGSQFEVEIWRIPSEEFGAFITQIPAPLCIGTLELENGESALGFLCETIGVEGQLEISHLSGFREYLAELRSPEEG
jgi:allophanate hydrolase